MMRYLVSVTVFLSSVNAIALPQYATSSYLFGGSQSDGASGQTLVLALSDGSSYIASTSTSPIGAESYAENFGWWNDKIGHYPGNYNYFAGYNGVYDSVYRNFFAFDLSGMHGTVVAASLKLAPYAASFPFAPMRFDLFDVSTSATDLLLKSSFDQVIFDDLGSGKLYGSFGFHNNPSTWSTVSIDLTAAAISDINLRQGQYFSLGGVVEQMPAQIPEPPILGLVLLGFISSIFLRSRSKGHD